MRRGANVGQKVVVAIGDSENGHAVVMRICIYLQDSFRVVIFVW